MSNERPHFLAQRIQDRQRQAARPYTCPNCLDEPNFQSEQKLWEHATSVHSAQYGNNEASRAESPWRQYVQDAANKTRSKTTRKTVPNVALGSSNGISKRSSNDSMQNNLGEDARSRSPFSRPVSSSGTFQHQEKRIGGDFEKLSIKQVPNLTPFNIPEDRKTPAPPSNRRKWAAVGASDLPDQSTLPVDGPDPPRNRRAKALSGGPFPIKDPEFDRKATRSQEIDFSRDRTLPSKRLFDPSSDKAGLASNPRQTQKPEVPSSRRVYDSRTHVFRPKKSLPQASNQVPTGTLPGLPHYQRPNAPNESFHQEGDVDSRDSTNVPPRPDSPPETEPEMLLQPETRPISHEQLVVEVKGIYAGLVMVEAKCVDVDEKQSAAAQEKDPSKQIKLTNEQWQALIALHKTLLHEHHDFFLASQHPSASPPLSKLAAKYSMPARMWRHGIHGFLEVLRHRLPDSLDHMLAFIYIAYSMMALLYETVSLFEDTWIECLGDLGRYRMAIEDDDIRDREVWSGVARFWYGKAADKSPNVGRLYHHLGILARPFTLQQLSLYARSLTCIQPFESAKGSIMTVFNPILEGRESAYHRATSMETIFIKAHGILFTQRPFEEFDEAVQQLFNGLIDNYIKRVTARFKENGVFAALSNFSSLFEYGAFRSNEGGKSLFRFAYENARAKKLQISQQQIDGSTSGPVEDSTTTLPHISVGTILTPQELKTSTLMISHASNLTFGTLSIALRRFGDLNVYPLVHVYLVFLLSLVEVEVAMVHVEQDVPWNEIASFLNTLARPEVGRPEKITPKVKSTSFPQPESTVGRPLPEDFVMRGQLWTEYYFPNTWFEDAAVDDEERVLELASMAADRIERILWLGFRIASYDQCLKYDKDSNRFVTNPGILKQRSFTSQVPSPTHLNMDHATSYDEETQDVSIQIPDSPPLRPQSPFQSEVAITQLGLRPELPSNEASKVDIDMKDAEAQVFEAASPALKPLHPDSAAWLGDPQAGQSPNKTDAPDLYASDPRKLEIINDRDAPVREVD